MSKQDVIKFLSSLSEFEIAEILYEASASKREEKKHDSGDFQIDNALCLAVCSYGSFENKPDDMAIVELVAMPSEDKVDNPSDAVLTEQGECDQCNTPLIGATKVAVCPVCKSEAYLT